MTDEPADKTSRIKIGNYLVFPEDAALIEAYNIDQKRRGLLPATLTIREQRLALVAQDCGPLLQMVPQQIEEWLDTRKKRDGSPVTDKTRSCWLSDLSAMFEWAVRVERIGANPIKKIVRPKLRHKGPRPIAEPALARALDSASGVLKCWITIEALGGLRCKEVCYLEAGDIDRDRHVLLIRRGKGEKERRVPLHPTIVDVLDATEGLPKTGRLWPTATPAKVSRAINDHFHGLGIRDTAHALRHLYGTSVYKLSKDLRLTQSLMGHASPSTTAGYADFDQDAAFGVVSAMAIPVSANPQVSVVA